MTRFFNALIALGLARYGLKTEVLKIFEGLFEATGYMDLRRLPELFCGFPWRKLDAPTLYPVACMPQAWASATVFALVQASLWISFDQAAGEIRFDRPMLPEFLDELHLRGLQTRSGVADVMLRRYDSDIELTITRRPGNVPIVLEGSKADIQIRNGSAKIGLGLGGSLPERLLHVAHARFGSVEHPPPSRGFWQCSKQAFVEKIIHTMDLTAKGRPVVARGGQNDAIGLRYFPGGKAAAVAGRHDHDRRHRGASPRQSFGELVGTECFIRPPEP